MFAFDWYSLLYKNVSKCVYLVGGRFRQYRFILAVKTQPYIFRSDIENPLGKEFYIEVQQRLNGYNFSWA